jgi:hypothetical protein
VTPARPRRWATVWLPLALAGLVGVLVAVYLVIDVRGSADTQSSPPSAAGRPVPSSELEGVWSGSGSLTHCAGFDEGCSRTRSISLTIDCSGKRCQVIPFDDSYGSPSLRFRDGRYRAAGPVPAAVAPRCGGSPAYTDLWRLEVTVRGGRLVGSYAESTVQSFDCGATGVAWDVVLDRR